MPRIGGALDVAQVGEQTTPQQGRSMLYFKSDSLLYSKAPDGTERQIGGASEEPPPQSATNFFVGPEAPVVAPGTPYMWVQTGLGPSGTDTTFWIEDGS